jgi:hypothetical protein
MALLYKVVVKLAKKKILLILTTSPEWIQKHQDDSGSPATALLMQGNSPTSSGMPFLLRHWVQPAGGPCLYTVFL